MSATASTNGQNTKKEKSFFRKERPKGRFLFTVLPDGYVFPNDLAKDMWHGKRLHLTFQKYLTNKVREMAKTGKQRQIIVTFELYVE